MKIIIPDLWVLDNTLVNFPATDDKQALISWLSPLGKKSGYAKVKYIDPKKEIFTKGHIKNAIGDLRIEKIKSGETVKKGPTIYLQDFESISLDPVVESTKGQTSEVKTEISNNQQVENK